MALTETAPLPRTNISATLSRTGIAKLPLPVTVLLTLFVPLVKITSTAAPTSAVTVTTPVIAVASEVVAPLATPVPRARTGGVGGMVSRLKEVLSVGEILPAVSVAMALTVIRPSPSVVRSAALSRAGTGVLPFPVMIFVTVLEPLVKVTTTEALVSAVTVTTPLSAVASDAVAPLATPVPRAMVGAAGGVVSRMKEAVPVGESLPAASVAMATTVIVPSPSAARSAAVSCTGTTVLSSPVRTLLTVLEPLEKLTTTKLPLSAVTVTTPGAAVAFSAVAPSATPVPRVIAGVVGS